MNTNNKKFTIGVNRVLIATIAIAVGFTMMPGFVPKAHSNDGAFIGGMAAAHVVGGAVRRNERRTEAEEYQAYNQPRTQQAAPAHAAQPQTAKQKLNQLDKLAAGGYITPAEYKAKKKAIVDSM